MQWIDPLSRRLCAHSPDRAVIVLMYHGTPGAGVRPLSAYSVPADRFAAQLDFLGAAGWATATVAELADAGSLPPRTALLTFDDGYFDNYEGAFRPLLERGMRATWFVASGGIGRYADWTAQRNEQTAMMTNAQLRELAGHGMEIGSHSVTHPRLPGLPPARLRREVARSKTDLEDLLGRPVASFAYPYGLYDDGVVAAVAAAGYRHACTTRCGWHRLRESPLLIRRVTVFGRDSLGAFARKLAFADNEVGWRRLLPYLAARTGARLGQAARFGGIA
jgi:peptidoglycan/xylan/chitin deacetylase (PgdA/CDA1 family)